MLVYVDRRQTIPVIKTVDDAKKFYIMRTSFKGWLCLIVYTHEAFTGDDDDYEVVAALPSMEIGYSLYELVAKQLRYRKADQRTVASVFRQIGRKLCHLDHLPLMMSVVSLLDELGVSPENIVSCNVTDTRLYLKLLTPRLEGEIEKGDVVQGGLVLSNSEVGQGSVSVQPLIFRLACLNGAIMQDAGLKKHHLGGILANQASDGAWELLSDETKKLADDAFFATVQDVVRGTLNQQVFDMQLEKMRAANREEIQESVPAAVETLAKSYSLSEAESNNVLENFIKGSSFTKWGLANAVTLASQDVESYDRATELERIGGQVIEMPDGAWSSIATAKATPAKAA